MKIHIHVLLLGDVLHTVRRAVMLTPRLLRLILMKMLRELLVRIVTADGPLYKTNRETGTAMYVEVIYRYPESNC